MGEKHKSLLSTIETIILKESSVMRKVGEVARDPVLRKLIQSFGNTKA